MPKKQRDIIEYVVCCVSAFSERYGIVMSQAYAYLSRHSGIDFLMRCYDAEHTLSIDDAVDDLQAVCYRHGGHIA
ncbi:MAG: DUF3791 domain-containing protein [Bacteroidaceae bacterium]|nr:DUF3791 domain-containing protein [Bacteroidaceae bacterium]